MTSAGLRDGTLLRIFLDERDRAGPQPLYTAVVEHLRKRGVSGATVFRGIEGFGSHHRVHAATVLSWTPNLPIVIEVVEDPGAVEALLPGLRELVGEGVLSLQKARYIRL